MMKNKMRALCLVLALFLVGCQTELYTNVSQKEGNEMLSILLSEGVVATKEPDKDNKVKLMVDSSQIAFAVDALKRKGYPREQFSTLKEVFPKDDLISSPLAERARLVYAKSQELSSSCRKLMVCWWRESTWYSKTKIFAQASVRLLLRHRCLLNMLPM